MLWSDVLQRPTCSSSEITTQKTKRRRASRWLKSRRCIKRYRIHLLSRPHNRWTFSVEWTRDTDHRIRHRERIEVISRRWCSGRNWNLLKVSRRWLKGGKEVDHAFFIHETNIALFQIHVCFSSSSSAPSYYSHQQCTKLTTPTSIPHQLHSGASEANLSPTGPMIGTVLWFKAFLRDLSSLSWLTFFLLKFIAWKLINALSFKLGFFFLWRLRLSVDFVALVCGGISVHLAVFTKENCSSMSRLIDLLKEVMSICINVFVIVN